MKPAIYSYDADRYVLRKLSVSRPLTEENLLDLNEKCLTNGIQYIEVEDMKTGREIITMSLSSLNCFDRVGYITLCDDSTFANGEYRNLIHELEIHHCLDKPYYFFDYFLNTFAYDFLWIECCQQLETAAWLTSFISYITKFNVDRSIPILIVLYSS